MSRNNGFTLVELLVAMAIFALISGFAYRSLNAMLDSREAVQNESRKWRDVAVFVGRVERDLDSVLPRVGLGSSGAPIMPVSSALDTVTDGNGLAVTRAGTPLQDNALAAPQRVAYRLKDGAVERLTWASVDAPPRSDPAAVRVLPQVTALAFRFLDAKSGEWRATWGLPGSAENNAPAAVEMSFTLASGETIVRLMDLPASP